jgi:hypothetical protein
MNQKMFDSFPGASKLMDRLFRKVDGVVWDLMTGRIGVKTADGIATMAGEGDDAEITVNLIDQFGMAVPAFAQNTPVDAVNVGDVVYFGKTDAPGWVIEVKKSDKGTSFVLLKQNGTRTTWKPPKIAMLGMDTGGVMVLRSLLTMLPNGQGGLEGLQAMMMPMLYMGGDSADFEEMMPMMLMSMMGNAGGTAGQNPMMQMMPMMMFMQAMKKKGGGFSSPFGRD